MPRTLLLADDSVTIQRVIELTFADEDIQVVAVSDGDQAIERLERTTPDIVLADIGMPGRNGYEVAQYIRNTPRLAHIPVVLLTGAFEPVDQERAAEAGCDGVLAKPFEPQMVIGRVKELLARPRPPAAVSEAPAPEPAPVAPPAPAESVDQLAAPMNDEPQQLAAPEAGAGELNDYFDRLDAAFANLGSGQSASRPAAAESAEAPITEHWDLDSLDPPPSSPDLSLSLEPPSEAVAPPSTPVDQPPVSPFQAAVPAIPPAPVVDHVGVQPSWATVPETMAATAPAAPFAPAPSIPAPSARPAQLPALADAFAALLAAEQGTPLPEVVPGWPATAAPSSAPAAPPEITDELIETISRRVLDRLSDQVVRETVSDIVSRVAERVIAEEIARIKDAIG